jgi:hypothetical protein
MRGPHLVHQRFHPTSHPAPPRGIRTPPTAARRAGNRLLETALCHAQCAAALCATGIRRSRYRGQATEALAHVFSAVAICGMTCSDDFSSRTPSRCAHWPCWQVSGCAVRRRSRSPKRMRRTPEHRDSGPLAWSGCGSARRVVHGDNRPRTPRHQDLAVDALRLHEELDRARGGSYALHAFGGYEPKACDVGVRFRRAVRVSGRRRGGRCGRLFR